MTYKAADSKLHYPILDGLRGTAALLVVAFHLMESVTPDHSANLLHHGYLAVDFFFALSGYVIGYAYDDRWRKGYSVSSFVVSRLVRLHPVVVIGVISGLISYFLDPFPGVPHTPAIASSALALIAGMILIPSWTLPDRGTDYFPYNGVFWTLFFEYVANLAYVFVFRSLSRTWLALLTFLAAGVLLWRAAVHDTIHLGYDWHTLDMAPVRLAYPFLAGLLMQRTLKTFPIRLSWLPLSALLLVLFAAPRFAPSAGIHLNGLYDAFVAIVMFPLIIGAGAHTVTNPTRINTCTRLGRLSYPLYGTHYVLIYIYADWIAATKPDLPAIIGMGLATWLLAVGIGWVVVVAWDEPIRRRLSKKVQGSDSHEIRNLIEQNRPA
jgi:peptidoglycan/LPS O-acetylase OafA/YrhL